MARSNTLTPGERSGRRLLFGGLTLIFAATVALWLTWGFRWPPTIEVVMAPKPATGRPTPVGPLQRPSGLTSPAPR